MEGLSERVLGAIQSGFPLQPDPYGELGRRLGLPRQAVLDAVASLRRDGTIRRLGASFASGKLGYASTLCALSVPGDADAVDRAAGVVSACPNVTHNYLRDDDRYNLWFTVIARDGGEAARILDGIRAATGCDDALNLPATALYKIRVDFGAAEGRHAPREDGPPPAPLSARAGGKAPGVPFDPDDPFDVALVRWAQGDVAGSDGTGTDGAPDPEPFATAAALMARELGDAGIDERRVLGRLRELVESGAIRRFGALVAHRKMGYAFNGMTVWDIPAGAADRVGGAFAAQPFVSHCYARPRHASWPYNLYAMVHAKTRGELDGHVSRLRAIAGAQPRVLLSTREYKKSSMRYFE